MKDRIYIVGSGVSAVQFQFDRNIPIMAVSSGYEVCPRIDHFVTLDKAMCFPKWLRESEEIAKHVADWDNSGEWIYHPNVRTWKYEDGNDVSRFGDEPFQSGPLEKSNVPARRHNSLLFAVQVAAGLGFNECLFIGCDLLAEDYFPVSDVLKQWYPLASGIRWFNASPLSMLCEWMPPAEKMMEVASGT